jgi:hypothetical protein
MGKLLLLFVVDGEAAPVAVGVAPPEVGLDDPAAAAGVASVLLQLRSATGQHIFFHGEGGSILFRGMSPHSNHHTSNKSNYRNQ